MTEFWNPTGLNHGSIGTQGVRPRMGFSHGGRRIDRRGESGTCSGPSKARSAVPRTSAERENPALPGHLAVPPFNGQMFRTN